MMITMLAVAMTLAMLIGTVFGLREEAERIKVESRASQNQGFGAHRSR
ncbi:hypothetical protein RB623_02220 [Mesorhizobium sp. LHD-90]|nr:hypothetical protein [Mesorhizobium sp. LHD-90]MDQ6432867.1 hypothetical protein [Mesorhizobium sp. LHD-90]